MHDTLTDGDVAKIRAVNARFQGYREGDRVGEDIGQRMRDGVARVQGHLREKMDPEQDPNLKEIDELIRAFRRFGIPTDAKLSTESEAAYDKAQGKLAARPARMEDLKDTRRGAVDFTRVAYTTSLGVLFSMAVVLGYIQSDPPLKVQNPRDVYKLPFDIDEETGEVIPRPEIKKTESK